MTMHWLLLYVLLRFPNFALDPSDTGAFLQELQATYGKTVVADSVEFTRDCVNGAGPCL